MRTKKKPVTFVDLFAGAGGVSEGFLQAKSEVFEFDFLLASDINTASELTHYYRYNVQLKMETEFLTLDVSRDDFIPRLRSKLGARPVDVVCGGPPCQSFSLAGKRKKLDKKDDLFASYLKVIDALEPKYFVMENVLGLLTKDQGKIPGRIAMQVGQMVDHSVLGGAVKQLASLAQNDSDEHMRELAEVIRLRLVIDTFRLHQVEERAEASARFSEKLSSVFANLVTSSLTYQQSRSDKDILSIRHGFRLLSNASSRTKLAASINQLAHESGIDSDSFEDVFVNMMETLSTEHLVSTIRSHLAGSPLSNHPNPSYLLLDLALQTYMETPSQVLDRFVEHHNSDKIRQEFDQFIANMQRYRLTGPLRLNAADFGVPQQRERIVFIGSRSDQKLIEDIPPKLKPSEYVTIREAIGDLECLEAGETKTTYDSYNPSGKLRSADSTPKHEGQTFIEWSRFGRLAGGVRRKFVLSKNAPPVELELPNHESSSHSPKIIKRLKLIQNRGGYSDKLNDEMAEMGVATSKRSYWLLDPNRPSQTITTMPDDYVHYAQARALTVREMARLQSFDDDFVFQGKRTTGGERRKVELPQPTLVGNAVPPLLARAIGEVILNALEGIEMCEVCEGSGIDPEDEE